jgi:hypothetical protein
VSEIRILRRRCGPKKELAGRWRKMGDEFHNLYSSTNITILG